MANIEVGADINSLLISNGNLTNSTAALGVLGAPVTSASIVGKLGTPSSIIVNAQGTDLERGVALSTAYAAAKLLTPNGLALSATNRAVVLLPKGAYKRIATLLLDADFVDIEAQYSENGVLPTDADVWINDGLAPMSLFRPPSTFIYSDQSGITVVQQSVRNIRLKGFGIAQIFNDTTLAHPPSCAFLMSLTTDEANDQSCYDQMYFWHRAPFHLGDGIIANSSFPTGFAKHVRGQWTNCIDSYGGTRVGLNGNFSATMYNCTIGPYSIGGDATGGSMGPCHLEQVHAFGCTDTTDVVAPGCFGGCVIWGIPSLSTAYFIDCTSGYGSFNIGAIAAGNYIRCKVRTGSVTGASFGSSETNAYPAEFSGYAEDCYCDNLSFGAGDITYNKCTGTLVRCNIEKSDRGIAAQGANISYSTIKVIGSNTNAINLLDNNSSIVFSRLETPPNIKIITATRIVNEVTLTTSKPHGMTQSSTIKVSGIIHTTGTNPNGVFTCNATTTGVTIKYTVSGALGSYTVASGANVNFSTLGHPISASIPREIIASGNTMNNGERYPTGIHPNVTIIQGRDSNTILGAPQRIKYNAKFAESFFNNPTTVKKELVGILPLTASQAKVGTRIILRGEYLMQFASTIPSGSDLAFVITPNETNGDFEGAVFLLGASNCEYTKVNLELILAASPTAGKFEIKQNCQYGAMQISLSGSSYLRRFLNFADGTFVELGAIGTLDINQNIKFSIHSSSPTNLSECNFALDLTPEIYLP